LQKYLSRGPFLTLESFPHEPQGKMSQSAFRSTINEVLAFPRLVGSGDSHIALVYGGSKSLINLFKKGCVLLPIMKKYK
jgi:hypothetical protein